MNTDINNMDGKSLREFMEAVLDYEMRGAVSYPLWGLLRFCGFEWFIGQYYGWKVNLKIYRMTKREPLMDAIIKGRPEGRYFE